MNLNINPKLKTTDLIRLNAWLPLVDLDDILVIQRMINKEIQHRIDTKDHVIMYGSD